MAVVCGNRLENGILCGSFGCVVKVKDTDTNTHYAGKIAIGNEKSETSLQREYDILKKLNQVENPHMIKLKRKTKGETNGETNGEIEELCNITLEDDYTLQDERGKPLANIKRGTTYKMMVMEYLSGGDLFDYVQKQRDLNDIHRIFVQIIDAVEFCHQNGVYHLDLKTENFVFADKEKTILNIIDFGLAKDGNDICKGPRPFGTPGFFAPELFKDEEFSCAKCDIFSIGIILLTMVRPRIIHHSQTGFILNTQRNYDKYVENVRESIQSSDLPTELKNLLIHMITIDPKKRYDIEEIKKSEWYSGKTFTEFEIDELESYKDIPGRYVAEQIMNGKPGKGCIIS